jgi:hypothetical protein
MRANLFCFNDQLHPRSDISEGMPRSTVCSNPKSPALASPTWRQKPSWSSKALGLVKAERQGKGPASHILSAQEVGSCSGIANFKLRSSR